MRRAKVLDWGLQQQLWPHMETLRPRPSVYIPEFIAANQSARADNLIPGTRAQQVQHLLPLPFAPPPATCFPFAPRCPPFASLPPSRGSRLSGHLGRLVAQASTGDLHYLPPRPSWSRSEGTSAISSPARGWTKSLCCGQQTRSASANWSQASMTPQKTCCVPFRWVHPEWSMVRASPKDPSPDCLLVPTARSGGVTLHTLRCGQHLGGLCLPQWVPAEHSGARRT